MAITPSTAELPRHLEVAAAPNPAGRAKHWATQHRTLLLTVVWVLSLLVAFEVGHWIAEGMPPPREHLAEFLDHATGMVGKYLWRCW